jgi:DNA repair protein SbcD/Mre11
VFRFLHAADIHLDSPLRGLETYADAPVDEIRGATRRAFDKMISLAIEEEVNFVLIAGDLYDGDWKDYNTGLFLTSRMGRLEKAGIRVFMVSGNHDAASQITKAMPLPPNVTLFSPRKPATVTLDDLGAVIHGQSYISRAVVDNLALHYPDRHADYFNVGLLHTSLTGREGHEPYAPCTPDDLKSKGYDYWALGHVHNREIIAEEPWIVFPGNIQGRSIKETGAKGVTLVQVDDGRICSVADCPLDVLRWSNCFVNLTECSTREEVYDRVRIAMVNELTGTDDKPVVLRLHLHGACQLHADLLGREFAWSEEFRGIAAGAGRIWLEKVKYRTRSIRESPVSADDDTPLAGLVNRIRQLDFSDSTLCSLIPEYASLRAHIPAELTSADQANTEDPEYLTELRENVKELLITRLLGESDQA